MTFRTELDDRARYLDTERGEIIYPGDDATDFEPEPRHEPIPQVESGDEYRVMAGFGDDQHDAEDRERLQRALRGKGAFRRFRDEVRELGLERRWFAAKANADRARAVEWLAAIVLEPVDASPRRTDRDSVEPAPEIELVDLLVLGGPGGKTELLGGRVPRALPRHPQPRRG